jgi:hypothetical protein
VVWVLVVASGQRVSDEDERLLVIWAVNAVEVMKVERSLCRCLPSCASQREDEKDETTTKLSWCGRVLWRYDCR